MYMTVVALARRQHEAGHEVDAAIVHDVIWALAPPDSRLEHTHVATVGSELRIFFFFNARTPGEAEAAGLRLCARACSCSPALRGWEISE